MSNALVVATNRPERMEAFLGAWKREPLQTIVVVEDNPRRTVALPEHVHHHCWEDIEREPHPEIYSRRDSAIKSFGFYKAWQLGSRYIFVLDDDCLPGEPASYWVEGHLRNLEATPRWRSSVPDFRVRGLPYRNVGKANVAVSMGLWFDVPDLDALGMLLQPREVSDREVARWGTQVAPAQQYFPFCGMNFAFRRDATPLMYFPPMGEGSPYGRFDDIWCGLVLQRICRHLGLSITVGQPSVRHSRASDPFQCLIKEAPGIRENEALWEIVDALDVEGTTPATCMRSVGRRLLDRGREGGTGLDAYLLRWGESIGLWCDLFEPTPRRADA